MIIIIWILQKKNALAAYPQIKDHQIPVREWLGPKRAAVKSCYNSSNNYDNKGIGQTRSINRATHERITTALEMSSAMLRQVLEAG